MNQEQGETETKVKGLRQITFLDGMDSSVFWETAGGFRAVSADYAESLSRKKAQKAQKKTDGISLEPLAFLSLPVFVLSSG